MTATLLRGLFGTRKAGTRPVRSRPSVEALKDRCLMSANPPLLVVPVHAVRVADDDGRFIADVTTPEIKQWVDKANEIYSVAGIQLDFDPNDPADFSTLNRTLINRMMGDKDPAWASEKAEANAEANKYPGKMTVFFRYGAGPGVTGGFSWEDLNFIAMPDFKNTWVNGHQNIQLFAHEVGHYLGLRHTFAREFKTVADAQAYFNNQGHVTGPASPNVFDGDGLSDTPPDPYSQDRQGGTSTSVILSGTTFTLPRTNIMSYYDSPTFTLSPQQIDRVREFVRARGVGLEWGGESFHGIYPSSAPAAASWGADRIDLFYRGANGHLFHRAWNGSSWIYNEDLHAFEGTTGNQGILTSKPAAVSWGPNRIDIFYRGQNNHLWHRAWDGTRWTTEEDLGGVLTSAPTVASWGNNRLDVFYRGSNNHLWHMSWDGSRWTNHEDLGGYLTSDPAAVSWGYNRIDIAYRGSNNHLWHKAWAGTFWTGETDLGGDVRGAPAISSGESGRLDIFYRGPSDHLWHRWWDGLRWRGGQDVGGILASDPGAVARGPGRIDTFYNGQNFGLWQRAGNLLTGNVGGDQAAYTASGYTGSQNSLLKLSDPGVWALLNSGDDVTAPLSLGVSTFRFYGSLYSSLHVSSNGLITFGTANTSYSNTDLTSFPVEAAIAPLWDDYIKTSGSPMVLYRFQDTTGDGVADRVTIQWNDVYQYSSTRTNGLTFQAILGLNSSGPGSVTFNYLDLDAGSAALNNGASATVGIKAAGTQGSNRLLVSRDSVGPHVAGGRAIQINHASAAIPANFLLPSFFMASVGTFAQGGGLTLHDSAEATPVLSEVVITVPQPATNPVISVKGDKRRSAVVPSKPAAPATEDVVRVLIGHVEPEGTRPGKRGRKTA